MLYCVVEGFLSDVEEMCGNCVVVDQNRLIPFEQTRYAERFFSFACQFFEGGFQTVSDKVHRTQSPGEPPCLVYRLNYQSPDPIRMCRFLQPLPGQLLTQNFAQNFDAYQMRAEIVMKVM